MGCTSSAPSVVTPDANATTEHIVKFVQSDKDINDHNEITEDRNETKDLNVLPKCYTLADPIQVVRINKSLSDLHNLDNVRDNEEMENVKENNNGNKLEIENVKENNNGNKLVVAQGDKISSLEDVVERVIEHNVNNFKCDQYDQNTQNDDQQNHNITEDINKHETTATLEVNKAPVNENTDDMQKDENCEEAISPTQSESSRVTRWEALADIAAELPPSLAVDPITGQIYALSK